MGSRKEKRNLSEKLFSEQNSKNSSQENKKRNNFYQIENKLNDLNTREWIKSTKSVWYSDINDIVIPHLENITSALRKTYGDERTEKILGQVFDSLMLSRPPRRDALKEQHPATFAESDIAKFIQFFSKAGERVLDPFLGSGSTLVACKQTGRAGVGVEVVPKWAELARKRIFELVKNEDPKLIRTPKKLPIKSPSQK